MEPQNDLLMLVHRIPYPPNKGDKIRSFNMLKFLASKGWRIHLCSLIDSVADLGYTSVLEEYCVSVTLEAINPRLQKVMSLLSALQGRPLSTGYFYRKHLQRAVDKILKKENINGILCFCSPMAEYLSRSSLDIFKSSPRPRLIMDLVDIDSDKWHQYAQRSRHPLKWVYQLESRLLQSYELDLVKRFDATILVSEEEAKLLRRRTEQSSKIHSIANGVDLDYFSPLTDSSMPDRRRMVFCGAMDYLPNVDAVCWFAKEVLPLVRQLSGDVDFVIVGSEPCEEVRALGSIPGVIITGRVDDVRPFVWDADLSVAPIRIARGIQNKVLEAMAMGKAVLATPLAFEGIEANPELDLRVAKAEPQLFAEAAASLLNNEGVRKELGSHARKAVEKGYCWDNRLVGLEALLSGSIPT